MYNISVPMVLKNIEKFGFKPALDQLKSVGASRVMLAIDSYIVDAEKKQSLMASIAKAVDYFKSNGFETGVWLWSFAVRYKNDFEKITSPDGLKCKEEVCPSDKAFCDMAADFIKSIAKCGVDFILFDDDYRYGCYTEVHLGCTCKNHMALISDMLGENLTASDIKDYLFKGGKNKYRCAFVAANRKVFLDFAKLMRDAVDSINPDIRFGLCACITTWDFDGASPAEICKVLAGNTKPLLRLIGAPYWAPFKGWGNSLSSIIELERLQASWCDSDIEIIAEGDTYPRPRYYTPSSYLEGFDTALRADGSLCGILKYMIDYCSSNEYETGYIKAHCENTEFYKNIERIFSNKECQGIRVYEAMRKYEDMDVPEQLSHGGNVYNAFFPITSKMLSEISVPTKYNGKGVGIAFGDNARYLPDNAAVDGLIIDIRAAKILQESGTDVGIKSFGDSISPTAENFTENGERVRHDQTAAQSIRISPNACVRSTYEDCGTPASFTYQNSNGEKYYVLNVDTYNSSDCFYRNYMRSKEIARVCKQFFLSPLPAYSANHPYLYIMAKKSADSNALSIGLWNFFADSIHNAEIYLDSVYKSAEFVNCSGALKGDMLTVDDVSAFGYCCIEVKK